MNITRRGRISAKVALVALVAFLAQGLVLVAPAYAGVLFDAGGDIYYSNNGVKATGYPILPEVVGDPIGTVNSYATEYAWRIGIDSGGVTQFPKDVGESNQPATNSVFGADPRCDCPSAGSPNGTAAAYSTWDVGDSQWTGNSPEANQTVIMAAVSTAGGGGVAGDLPALNGWTGPSWVGGAKTVLTLQEIQGSAFYNDDGNLDPGSGEDMVMEPIPTPVLQSSTASSVTIGWNGLWDNSTGAAGGVPAQSVVGYTVYRSVNGSPAFTQVANSIAQSAGNAITYTDTTVTTGNTYAYELGVEFAWSGTANPIADAYYEPAAQGPATPQLSPGVAAATMLKFSSVATSTSAGTASAIQTVATTNSVGTYTDPATTTTVGLTSTSTSGMARFYSVSAGSCTATVITNLTIATTGSTAQFCYYDQTAGTYTLTAAATGLTSATMSATVAFKPVLGILKLSVATSQADRVPFTGTDTLTAQDAYGNTITNFSGATTAVTFTVTPTATISGLDGVGNAQLAVAGDFTSGVATLSSKLALAANVGSYNLTASAAGIGSNTAVVSLGVGPLTHFAFALASPQSVASAFTGTDTVTAEDADNNVLTTFSAVGNPVAVTESTSSGTVTGLGATANVLSTSGAFVNGVANLSGLMVYTGSDTAPHTFKASTGAVNSTSNAVTFAVGPLNSFNVALSTPQANAVPFTSAVITALDAGSNPLTAFNAAINNVTVTVAGGGTLTGGSVTGAGSFSGGVAVLSGLLSYNGLAGSHLFTVTSANGKIGTETVNITAGAITSIKIVNGSTSSATAVTTSAITTDGSLPLWSAGYDVYGNWAGLVTSTWSSGGVGGNLTPAVSATGVNTTTFHPILAPASGTITATDLSASLTATTGVVTVTNGVQAGFAVTAPATATAGSGFTLPVIEAVDAHGNQVQSYTGPQTLVFSGPANSPNATAPSYPLSVTFTNGAATGIAVTLFKAQTVVLTVTQGSNTGSSAAIAVSTAAATAFTATAPAAATAGTSFSVALGVYDPYGNLCNGFGGSQTVVFSGPATSPGPVATPPLYPLAVSFTGGTATASITLYASQSTVLLATDGAISGSSNTIAVSAGPATTIALVAPGVPTQTGSVAQAVASPPVVLVEDGYGNLKNGYAVAFSVTAGGGSVNPVSVVTGNAGTATAAWTLGATAGTANNTLDATGAGLIGSPVVFSATAVANHFQVSVPAGIVASVPFQATVRLVDANNVVVASYGGTQTVTFSGPSPAGTHQPVYPATIVFVNGVAVPPPTITLVAVETTTLTVSAGTLSGVSALFAVAVGPAAQVAFATAAQTVTGSSVSGPVVVCLQDEYGNSAVAPASTTFELATTSRGGQFSLGSLPGGTWGVTSVPLGQGFSCATVYYEDLDFYPGVSYLQVGSAGLTAATQPIVQNGEPTTTTVVGATTSSTVTGSSTSTTVAGATTSSTVTGSSTSTTVAGTTPTTTTPPGPSPVMLKYLSIAPTLVAGTPSGVLTLETADSGGNQLAVTVDTTVSLNTSSTDPNALFYLAVPGGCTTTPIEATVVIPAGSSTVQFCYYDELAGIVALTAAANGLGRAVLAATVTANPTVASLALSLSTAQVDRVALSGIDTLTAEDAYGNTITGFSAAAHNVTFNVAPGTATAGGLAGAANAQLLSAGDFTNGVADLTSRLVLTGTAGPYTVTATAGAVSGLGSVTLGAGVANHFSFSLASPQQIATPFNGTDTLTALDADGNVVTGFDASITNVTVTESAVSGTVNGLDTGNVLSTPGAFLDGVADLSGRMAYTGTIGVHTFLAVSATANGTSNNVTFSAGPLASFSMTLNSPQINAAPFSNAVITALDAGGNVVTGFDASANNVAVTATGGTVTGGSLDAAGSFSAGVATLSGALIYTGAAGSQTLTAVATGAAGAATTTITAGPVVTIGVVNGPTSAAGAIGDVTLTADQTLPLWAAGYDVSGNWTGLVSSNWTSDGGLAPAVTATGVSTIAFNPSNAPASGAITATDAADGTITASTGTITITYGALNAFQVNGTPPTAVAGVGFRFLSIWAIDSWGNVVQSYTGTQTLVFSGPGRSPDGSAPSYPVSVLFNNGVATNVSVTLVKAETVQLSVTQAGITGTSNAIVVSAAAATAFTVTAPPTAIAGVPFEVTLAAVDPFGNTDLTFTGPQSVAFSGPGTSPGPVATAPLYPASVSFTNGAGSAAVTLYKQETATLMVADGSVSGASGFIGIAAAAAASIVRALGSPASQPGAVSMVVPLQPEVIVEDAYGNGTKGFPVAFSVPPGTGGGGTVNSAAVVTGTDGTATSVDWVLGSTAGTTNTLDATGAGLTGSPVTFTAIPNRYHFAITVPTGIEAGNAFCPAIMELDQDNNPVLVNATDSATFSGPSSLGSNNPVYPATITFVNGVAVEVPCSTATGITLAAAETPQLTVVVGGVVGTSAPFTVTAGAATQLATLTPTQTIVSGTVSDPITVCAEDIYGNSVITDGTAIVDLATTDADGEFSAHAAFTPTIISVTIGIGLSCTSFYYQDVSGKASSTTLTFTSTSTSKALSPSEQLITVTATTPVTTTTTASTTTTTAQTTTSTTASSTTTNSTSTTKPGTTTTTKPGRTTTTNPGTPTTTSGSGTTTTVTPTTSTVPQTTPTTGGGGSSGGTSTGGNTTGGNATGGNGGSVTVYVNVPTQPADQPIASPTIQIPIPTETFLDITSPAQGALVTASHGSVVITAVGLANEAGILVTGSGTVVAATTSDNRGNWRFVVPSSQLQGQQQTVHAELLGGEKSATVTFALKKESFYQKVLGIIEYPWTH